MEYSSTPKALPSAGVMAAYGLLLLSGVAMYHFIAQGEYSSILTMAAMLQTFGFGLLGMQIASCGHVRGISARALGLDALALVCRLSSTLWLEGYLPVDASGDWMYQAVDVCSLALVIWLLHHVLKVEKSTYQSDEDSFPAVLVVIVSMVLASFLHADMDDFPLFDAIWMAGLFISVVAVLPQLWLNARTGGRMEALTSHYIAAMAISRILSGLFMWEAREDVTCEPLIQGFNHGIWTILFAHFLHMVLLGDFTYYYVRSVAKGGLLSSVELGGEMWV